MEPKQNSAVLKKLVLLITVLTIVLVVGTTVVWMIVSMKKPTPLSPNAQIELKLAEKEPADGLMPMTLENMGVGSLYVHDKAELSTSDVAGVYMSKDGMDRPAITVVLTKAGGERMWSMTSANIDKHVVIFVNGQAVTAPRVNAPISKKFVVTGRGEEIDKLFRALTQP